MHEMVGVVVGMWKIRLM